MDYSKEIKGQKY